MSKEFIYCKSTDIRFYEGDIVILNNRPKVKWIVHRGWFIYNNVQSFNWYLTSIKTGEVIPVSSIDLTLVTLATTKTVGSELYDGKVVDYTRPYTDADEQMLMRSFISVDTLEQRDNLDPKKLVNGKLVRVNNNGTDATYYAWNANTRVWELAEFGSTGGIYCDTTEHWNHDKWLIGKKGCLYIYSDYKQNEKGQDIAGIKVGDGPILTKEKGGNMGPAGRETYYNLNMNGCIATMRRLGYSEEEYPYWVRDDGAKMLGRYVMIAANWKIRPLGTIIETSLGWSIVVDTGDFVAEYPYGVDIAVDW